MAAGPCVACAFFVCRRPGGRRSTALLPSSSVTTPRFSIPRSRGRSQAFEPDRPGPARRADRGGAGDLGGRCSSATSSSGGGRSAGRQLVRVVLRTATVTAYFYLLFLVTWGLNYRRLPLAAEARVRCRQRSRHGAAANLATTAVARDEPAAIRSRPQPRGASAGVDTFAGAGVRRRRKRQLGRQSAGTCPRVRNARCSIWYFRRAASTA